MAVQLRYPLLLLLLHTTANALQNLTLPDCPIIRPEDQRNSSDSCEMALNGTAVRFKNYYSTILELEVLSLLSDVNEVYVELNGIETIAQGVTRNDFLLKLHLSNNTIRDLLKSTFESTPNLQLLDLSFNKLAEKDLEAFHHLSSLQTLNLSHNNIESISSGNFQSLTSLDVLDLSHNSIISIGNSLSDHANLRSLFLQNNQLTYLTLKMNSLKIIDASFNSIRVLNLPDVYRLNLNHNNLAEINFNDIEVNVAHNNITKFRAFSNSRYIDASRNEISVITDSFFSNSASVEYADLSSNIITSIEANALDTLKQLKVFNISHNRIADFKVRVFDTLAALEILDISHNFFIYLYEIPFVGSFNFDALGKLNKIILNDNPWSCKFLKEIHTTTVELIGAHTTCKSDVNDFVIDFDKTVAIESEVDRSSTINYDDFVKMLNRYLETDFHNTNISELFRNFAQVSSSNDALWEKLRNLQEAVNTMRGHLEVDAVNVKNSLEVSPSNITLEKSQTQTTSFSFEHVIDTFLRHIVVINAIATTLILLVIVAVVFYIICKRRKYKVTNFEENY